MKRGLLVMTALIAAGAAGAQGSVTSLKTGEIAVDGVLDEAAWQEGEWSSGFTMLDNPAARPAAETRFKIAHDADAVYVGVELDEPSVATMKANIIERDGRLHTDDCVEIMLDPTGERIEYYHFIINSLGAVYDAQLRQGGNVQTERWDCAIQAAAEVGEGKWTVEVRLPVVELGLTEASTGDWAINVTRERYADGAELSSFVPITGGFHQPSLYAKLQLEGADFGPYLWQVKEPYETRVMPGDGAGLVYTAKTHVTNAGPAFQFIAVRGVLGETPGEWVKDGLDSKQGREYEISVPAGPGRQTLRIEVADRDDTSRLLSVTKTQVDVEYSPITITMIAPWYRDSIYATEEIDELVFVVDVALPAEEFQGREVRAALSAVDEATSDAGEVLARTATAAQPTQTISLAIPELADGEYVLDVWVETGEPGVPRARKTIRKLPKVADEWRIAEGGVLMHNGEPVLPFGWFSIPTEAMEDPEHAYVLMQEYNAQYRTIEQNRERLDSVVAAGTAVTMYPYQSNAMMTPAAVWGQPLTDEEAAGLRDNIAGLMDHPGVFAWYMADEPELRPALPERCRALYETIRDVDPYHPCIMLNDTIAGIYKYVDGGDILMPDPYPCYIKGGLAAQPIEKVGKFIQACADAGRGRKAIFATPQGFNYGDYGKKNQRGPNFAELRNELYQCVVYGAKGFLWYTYSHTQNYPDIDLGMKWLSFEVADLKDWILAEPHSTRTVTVEADQADHIHASVREANGRTVIIAVNTSTEPQDVTLSIAPAIAREELHVVSEGRTIALNEGAITDHFGTYETHIYTTDAELASRDTKADRLALIDEANAARRKPGNIAFEDNGTTVEVSSKSRYGSTPDRLVDGVTEGMRWTDGTPSELPDWVTVTWPDAQTVGRVVIYTSTIADFEVQVPDGDEWRTVGEAAGNEGASAETVLNEPVETTAVRIVVTGLQGEEKNAVIWEVEAYEE